MRTPRASDGRGGRSALARLHPAQASVLAFAVVALVGTGALCLPIATEDGSTDAMAALFTSVSAVCVTGLSTVDVPVYWSTFGEVTILVLIQIGGLGAMSVATILSLLVFRRLGLTSRITAAAEAKADGLGGIRGLLLRMLITSLLIEAITAIVLAVRFATAYDESWGRATYLGVFHAVSAFNNAGFALFSDSMIGFVTDPWICLPICLAVILGGLGFPVLLELRRHLLRPRAWNLHTKLTMGTYAGLLITGWAFVLVTERNNEGTLQPLSWGGELLASFFAAVMPRTAGFNSIDYGQMEDGTLLGTTILMFIGGGSAGTAGGIKVTTFILLFWAIAAEVRGHEHVNIGRRRIDPRLQRQALSVALLGVGLVMVSTLMLLEVADVRLGEALFEATSAFATVGLSTGITGSLPVSGQLIIVFLMFIGRLGPITLVSALALRDRQLRYTLPTARPLIG